MVKLSPKIVPQVLSYSEIQPGLDITSNSTQKMDPAIVLVHTNKPKLKAAPSILTLLSNVKVENMGKVEKMEGSVYEEEFPKRDTGTYPTLKISPGKWKCVYCYKTLTRKSILINHIRSHWGERPHVCAQCPRKFTIKWNLTRHMRTHKANHQTPNLPIHGPKPEINREVAIDFEDLWTPYTFQKNGKSFPLVNNGSKKWICVYCSKSLTRKSILINHIRIHTGEKPYVCAICSKGFTIKSNLTRHMLCHNAEQAPRPEQMDNMEIDQKDQRMFHNATQLGLLNEVQVDTFFKTDERHKIGNDGIKLEILEDNNLVKYTENKTARKRWKCIHCSKSLARKSILLNHLKIHTGEKPYPCSRCPKVFSLKANLTRHMRQHTGERPYKCESCGKTFSQAYNRNRHRLSHTGVKPFACSLCTKTFRTKYNLKKHQKVHNGKQTYICPLCPRKFSRQYNLDCHVRVHSGEMLYGCRYCSKRFSYSISLNRHERQHRSEQNRPANLQDIPKETTT